MARSLLLLALLLAPTFAVAQGGPPSPFNTRGTDQDRKACQADARRLCRPYLNNEMAVLSCFQQQRAKLSRPCQAVLRKYGQ